MVVVEPKTDFVIEDAGKYLPLSKFKIAAQNGDIGSGWVLMKNEKD